VSRRADASWVRLAFLAACGAYGCAAGAAAQPDAPSGAQAGAGGASGASGSTAGASAPDATAGAGGHASVDAAADRASAVDDGPTRPDAVVDNGTRDESARDATSADDATPDAVSRSGCVGTAFALCEDFEGGPLDTKLWKLTQDKGTVTLDATRGARGSKTSVHVHVEPGSDTTVGLIEAKTFPALKAGLFARAFIYIPGATATSLFTGDRHSRLIYAQGATPYGEYALGIWNGGIIQNHYSKTDDSVDTKMLPPFDRWFCLEYELDSAAGNVRAFLDDVEITALRHDGWPPSNIDTLMFGVDRYGAFPVAEDIWFDDLVVDVARIGCTR
jgi:hypothetical protein